MNINFDENRKCSNCLHFTVCHWRKSLDKYLDGLVGLNRLIQTKDGNGNPINIDMFSLIQAHTCPCFTKKEEDLEIRLN